IEFAASQIDISLDGTILATARPGLIDQYSPDASIKILSLPSGSTIYTWPYTYSSGPVPLGITLSGSGMVLGQVLYTPSTGKGTVVREVTATTGGPVTWSDQSPTFDSLNWAPIVLTRDGLTVAVSDTGGNAIAESGPSNRVAPPTTNIYVA